MPRPHATECGMPAWSSMFAGRNASTRDTCMHGCVATTITRAHTHTTPVTYTQQTSVTHRPEKNGEKYFGGFVSWALNHRAWLLPHASDTCDRHSPGSWSRGARTSSKRWQLCMTFTPRRTQALRQPSRRRRDGRTWRRTLPPSGETCSSGSPNSRRGRRPKVATSFLGAIVESSSYLKMRIVCPFVTTFHRFPKPD